MSRPVFFVEPGVAAGAGVGARVVLDGPEGRHAATVRRIGTGERVDLVVREPLGPTLTAVCDALGLDLATS